MDNKDIVLFLAPAGSGSSNSTRCKSKYLVQCLHPKHTFTAKL